ncbi:hypothetical protein L1887_16322 [Cichorium endivia]|nr:hypothetical protein L1887_16322 [Cichorium endivia]
MAWQLATIKDSSNLKGPTRTLMVSPLTAVLCCSPPLVSRNLATIDLTDGWCQHLSPSPPLAGLCQSCSILNLSSEGKTKTGKEPD